ncbi:MAG: GTP-binding protein [Saprospiraceae bacterium]|nr:GTP-binding protein [Saprospiraceae bacterium]
MKRIPVHILTGFLGAGKTTFLNHFIKKNDSERLFIIENEVGKENIDGGLIMEAKEIVELTAGCLCCSLNNKLLDVLEEASMRRDEYDRIVIETTGIADPSSIVKAFVTNPMVEQVFDLINVICLVDAEYIDRWLAETDEALRQIVMADLILVNKEDLVEPTQMEKVIHQMKRIAPYAEVYKGTKGQFPISSILSVHQAQLDTKMLQIESSLKESSKDKHAHKINTFALEFEQEFDFQKLGYELKRLLFLYAHQIYRIKGIISIDHPEEVILQSVGRNLVFTSGKAWETGQKRRSKIVFIGKDIQKEAIAKIINRALLIKA